MIDTKDGAFSVGGFAWTERVRNAEVELAEVTAISKSGWKIHLKLEGGTYVWRDSRLTDRARVQVGPYTGTIVEVRGILHRVKFDNRSGSVWLGASEFEKITD